MKENKFQKYFDKKLDNFACIFSLEFNMHTKLQITILMPKQLS